MGFENRTGIIHGNNLTIYIPIRAAFQKAPKNPLLLRSKMDGYIERM